MIKKIRIEVYGTETKLAGIKTSSKLASSGTETSTTKLAVAKLSTASLTKVGTNLVFVKLKTCL